MLNFSSSNILPKAKRLGNFKEVVSCLSKKTALEEARRFPQFTDPSMNPKCPLDIDIAGFIRLLREGNVRGALQKVQEQNGLPLLCGRLCPAPCENEFSNGGAAEKRQALCIRALERFVADQGGAAGLVQKRKKCQGEKVAVVGSGPAGLMAAACLAREDFQVVVLESLPVLGGSLYYGLAPFRLSRDVLAKQISDLEHLGIEFRVHESIGRTKTIAEILQQGFAAVVLAIGQGARPFDSLPGCRAGGVYDMAHILFRLNFMPGRLGGNPQAGWGERIIIIGDDAASLDCARTFRRLQKEVRVIFEKTEEECEAYQFDQVLAKEEEVQIHSLTRPLEILMDEDGKVSGVKCCALDYADPTGSGQWKLTAVPGSETVFEADTIVLSGKKNAALRDLSYLVPRQDITSYGLLAAGEDQRLKSSGTLFAAGAVIGHVGLLDALASGKRAAQSVASYLRRKGG